MKQSHHYIVVIVGLVGLIAASRPPFAQQSVPQEITFGLIGDLAYTAAQEPLLDNVLADLNRTPLAFIVHVGDLASQRRGCTDALLARRLEQFQASANPLIYTPGDNEWTDCHEGQGVAGSDPLERLLKLRALFFAVEESLGQRRIALSRQSAGAKHARYRENARWDLGRVTFLTVHVVGSNNGRGRNPAGDEEYAERNSANLNWLREGFRHAKAIDSRAVMILQQANMFVDYPPVPSDAKQEPNGFTDLQAALRDEVIAFGKPTVLVHGDSHYFRIDKPYMRRPVSGPAMENFTRVETFGEPHHHWVHVAIDPTDQNVFVFRPRIVPANLLKGQ
jgi:hypothetical protein